MVEIGFRRNLFNGRTTEVTVSYSLPTAPPPTELSESYDVSLEEQVVVNDATAGWSFFSDPGLDSWTATIELPPGFDEVDDDDAPDLWTEGRDDEDPSIRTLEASGDTFRYDFVVLENASAMLETPVEFGDHEIIVRYWPGDTAWRDRLVEQITENLPVMVELVGRPWPDRSLVVQESAQTLGTGYAGWYTSVDHHITIGPSVDDNLILHELAHVWFNFNNFHDRWLTEGLAEEFATLTANRVSDETDGNGNTDTDTDSSVDVSLSSRHAAPLKSWGWEWLGEDYTEEEFADSRDREAWGYDASWHTIRRTREIVGLESFTEVVSSILDGQRSYPGPGAEPVVVFDPDGDDVWSATRDYGPKWEEFFDIASAYGPDEEISDLYRDWVEGEATLRFDSRMILRTRMAELTDRLDGLVLPEAVREPMRNWDFDDAEEAIDAGEAFVDSLEDQRRDLANYELDDPADLPDRLAAIAAVDELDEYRAELTTAVNDLVTFEVRAGSTSLVEQIGLLRSTFDADHAEARARFSAGDFAGASTATDRATALADDAETKGWIRIAIAAALLVLLIAALLWFGRRRRRRKRAAEPSGQPPAAPSSVEDASNVDIAETAEADELVVKPSPEEVV